MRTEQEIKDHIEDCKRRIREAEKETKRAENNRLYQQSQKDNARKWMYELIKQYQKEISVLKWVLGES